MPLVATLKFSCSLRQRCLPRVREWAASPNPGASSGWKFLPRKVCHQRNAAEVNKTLAVHPFLGGKIFPDLASDLMLRCGSKCVTSEGSSTLLPATEVILLCSRKGKIPLFIPAVVWDAFELPPDQRTGLLLYQKISLSFRNDLQSQLGSGKCLTL